MSLDLAVAVVVGAAFTAIVTAFTNNIINPLIAAVGGANDLGWGLPDLSDNPATFINIGAVITAVINFVIIAAVVYFILIVPANAAKKRFITEPGDKKASEADLLIQIRDILADEPKAPDATIRTRPRPESERTAAPHRKVRGRSFHECTRSADAEGLAPQGHVAARVWCCRRARGVIARLRVTGATGDPEGVVGPGHRAAVAVERLSRV